MGFGRGLEEETGQCPVGAVLLDRVGVCSRGVCFPPVFCGNGCREYIQLESFPCFFCIHSARKPASLKVMSSQSPFVHNKNFEQGGCLGFFCHVHWLSVLEASFLD